MLSGVWGFDQNIFRGRIVWVISKKILILGPRVYGGVGMWRIFLLWLSVHPSACILLRNVDILWRIVLFVCPSKHYNDFLRRSKKTIQDFLIVICGTRFYMLYVPTVHELRHCYVKSWVIKTKVIEGKVTREVLSKVSIWYENVFCLHLLV